jgi:hypothetical protein
LAVVVFSSGSLSDWGVFLDDHRSIVHVTTSESVKTSKPQNWFTEPSVALDRAIDRCREG